MPVRASMQDLIARVRGLVGDPAGATATFADQTVQDYLDRERIDVLQDNGRQLRPDWPWLTGTGGGAINYYDYDGWRDWETDVILYDGGGNNLASNIASFDYLTGHVIFTLIQPSPVFIVGKSYDPYAAAKGLCLLGAALTSQSFDVGLARGESMTRSQKMKGWMALAELMDAQTRPRIMRKIRRDVYGAFGT
jgi:hypothetical protein